MKIASEKLPQSMLSVAGLDRELVDRLCEQAKAADPSVNSECKVANSLFPKGVTCAGTEDAISTLRDLCEKAGALQAKRLKATGAFHTKLMQPAQEALDIAFEDVQG